MARLFTLCFVMLSEYDNGNDDGGDVCIVLGWLDSVIYAKHLDFTILHICYFKCS